MFKLNQIYDNKFDNNITIINCCESFESWFRAHEGFSLRTLQVPQLLTIAYNKAETAETAVQDFKGSVIWLPNRHVFKSHHFSAASELISEKEIGNADRFVDSPATEILESESVIIKPTKTKKVKKNDENVTDKLSKEKHK